VTTVSFRRFPDGCQWQAVTTIAAQTRAGWFLLAIPSGSTHKNLMFTRIHPHRNLITVMYLAAALGVAAAADNPFIGGWALTIPGGGAGWLGVEEENGQLKANLLWGGGSVLPVASATVEDGKLIVTRNHNVQWKDANNVTVKTNLPETITATLDGDAMKLTIRTPRGNGQEDEVKEFTGQKVPPMPPTPDLKKVKFGKAIQLFNGKDLTGWRLTDPNAINGWSVKDGLLVNDNIHEEGQPHKNYGNLRTDEEFEDFNIKVNVRVGKGENSGVYLRGIYEVQMVDSYGKPPDPHNMGAVYSRIKPTEAAEKPAGEWQTLDITFVDRHVTVILNGKKIIDNQPVLGCTGGALWSDVTRPGPIYLQGDHTSIEYGKIVLRPVVKNG